MEKTKELVIILVLIGLLAYLPSLFGGFLGDDEDFVTKNAYVKELRISRFFTENAIAGAGKTSNYYRPLQFSLYSLLYRLAGPSPVLFHSASLLLHTAAAILAFLWLLRITGKRRFAFLASLLFLLHPVQTESVSYISGISDPLYAAFFSHPSSFLPTGARDGGGFPSASSFLPVRSCPRNLRSYCRWYSCFKPF